MNKTTEKSKLLLVIILIVLTITLCVGFNLIPTSAYAEEGTQDLSEICAEYTDKINGYFDSSKKLTFYENYVDDRFQVGSKYDSNSSYWTSDEWILEFIPWQLFDQVIDNYLYIGKSYGFYFDWDNTDNSYFVYFLLHSMKINDLGHLERQIEPLYYERYFYNPDARKASLKYVDSDKNPHFEKYSTIEKVYLKDIDFSGHLFNESHANQGDDDYNAYEDNGAYFVGGSYIFSGLSAKTDTKDFIIEVSKIMVGYIPIIGDYIGAGLDILELGAEFVKYGKSEGQDFRDRVTNEKENSFQVSALAAETQIKNNGGLSKSYLWEFASTQDKHGVLFGIHNQCYARNTSFYNYACDRDKWDTLFTGRVGLEIVKAESNDKLTTIAKVGSNSINMIIPGNEKREIKEDSTQNIIALNGANVEFEFTASQNGYYTFETFGDVKNQFVADKGDVTNKTGAKNQTLKVKLSKGEVFRFSSENTSGAIGRYSIAATFTPPELVLGSATSVTIAPDTEEYVMFKYNKLKPYTISIKSAGKAEFQLHKNSASNQFQTFNQDNDVITSFFDDNNGTIYLSAKNTDSSNLVVNFSISEARKLDYGATAVETFDNNLIFELNNDIGSKYNIKAETGSKTNFVLYNQNMQVIYTNDAQYNHEYDFSLQGQSPYYIKFINTAASEDAVTVTYNLKPDTLHYGNQSISQEYNSFLYSFHTTTEANYTIKASNSSIKVYEDNGTQVIPKDYYALKSERDYYVVVEGNDKNLTIGIESATKQRGTLNADGFVFVEFTPVVTYKYAITSNVEYDIYNSLLQKSNYPTMVADIQYYIRLKGTPSQNYSISVDIDCLELSTNVHQTVLGGYYKLNLSEDDQITFQIYTSDGKPITIMYGTDINNLDNSIISNSVIQMAAGTYYLRIVTQSEVTILILAENNSTYLHAGVPQIIQFVSNEAHLFNFQNDKGLQTYRLSVDIYYSLNYNIIVYDKQNSIYIYARKNDKYFEFQLENGEYAITYVCLTDIATYDSKVEIYIPTQFKSVKFNNIAPNNNTIELRMGVEYKLSIDTNIGTHPVIVKVGDTEIQDSYIFEVKQEGYIANVKFIDEYGEHLINVYAVFPVKVDATMTDYVLKAQINPVAEKLSVEYKITSIKAYNNNKLLASSENAEVDLVNALLFGNGNRIYGVVYVTINNVSYRLVTREFDFINTVIRLDKLNGNESRRLYVDAAIPETTKSITISSNVKAIFLIGNGKVVHKVQFKFPKSSSLLLYTEKFNTLYANGSAIVGAKTDLEWINEGTTSIKGAGSYAVELKRLKAVQYLNNSNITVEGIGKSGMYIHDTLVLYSGNLTIIGGAGADGEPGTKPPDAFTSSPYMNAAGASGDAGSNGANGSRGGHGLIVTNNFSRYSGNLTCTGGIGGQGGQGGTGGTAGYPHVGVSSNGMLVAGRGSRGGHGGTGGNGGFGGIGGNALVILNLTKATDYNWVTCNAGGGGKGGTGGTGGKATDGARGGDDHWIWSDKGDCHCGGDGGDGGDAGKRGRGGYNGAKISKTLDGCGALSDNHGDLGQAGIGGKGGGYGDEGAGGSPNNCKDGHHEPGRDGARGKVPVTIFR